VRQTRVCTVPAFSRCQSKTFSTRLSSAASGAMKAVTDRAPRAWLRKKAGLSPGLRNVAARSLAGYGVAARKYCTGASGMLRV
jgi:hypothetical protein